MNRDGVRWYEIGSLDGTPAVMQSGTLHDTAPGADARNYFNASIATSAEGRTVIGFSAAGTNEYVNAGAVDRFAADAAGTLQAPALLTAATAAYNPRPMPASAAGRRWGSYSETVMDACDGTTIWSLQQFTDTVDSYGLRWRASRETPPGAGQRVADVRAGKRRVDRPRRHGRSWHGGGCVSDGARGFRLRDRRRRFPA